MVNVKGESVDRGSKCIMERKSPRPHTITQLMMKELTACSVKCSGRSAERYWHRPICLIGSRVVSCHGFTVGVAVGWVFLER